MNIKKLSFPKKLRLTSSQEFVSVFENSHKITTNKITTFTKKNNLNFSRIGIIISKKHIKHAHKRNYIKRLIRESFRTHQHFLSKTDFIVTIQKKITKINNESIKQTLKNIWLNNYDANFKDANVKFINKTNTHISNAHQPIIK